MGSPMECFLLVQRRGKGACRLRVPPAPHGRGSGAFRIGIWL